MAALPRESLQVEPAVKASAANRDLKQKNNRASHNWQRAKIALEREKQRWKKENLDDRNKLLKQRQELRSTSLSLTKLNSESPSEDEGAVSTKQVRRQMSLKDVYDALITAQRKEQDDSSSVRSVKSDSTVVMSSTASFERKRVGRKSVSFSLQGLQKANNSLQSKLQALEMAHQGSTVDKEIRPHSGSPASHFDLTDEERSLGPTLRLPPSHLPPIARGVNFKPRVRNFKKDQAFIARQNVKENTLDDIRYCRYLRKVGRSRSDLCDTTRIQHHHYRPSRLNTKP